MEPDFTVSFIIRVPGKEGDAAMTMIHHMFYCLVDAGLVIDGNHGLALARCNTENRETLIAQLVKIA